MGEEPNSNSNELNKDEETATEPEQLKLWCSNLKTGSRGEKLDALKKLGAYFASDKVNDENIEEMYGHVYLHLLQVYSDKSEVNVVKLDQN